MNRELKLAIKYISDNITDLTKNDRRTLQNATNDNRPLAFIKLYKKLLVKEEKTVNRLIVNHNKKTNKINRDESNKTQQKQNKKEMTEFMGSFDFSFTKQKKQKNLYPMMEFKKLNGYINNWYKKVNKKTAFSFILKSSIADVELPAKFHCKEHFDNWFKKIIDNEVNCSSSGHFVEIKSDDTKKGLFDDIIIVKNLKVMSGGCNKHAGGSKNMKSSFYTYKLFNPCSMKNNCLFHCIQKMSCLVIDSLKIRKQFNIATNTPICVSDAYKIIHSLNLEIEIIDYDTNELLDADKSYIVLKENHFYVVESFEENNRTNLRTKRGNISFDFETRPSEEYHLIKASGKKSYILKDSICGVDYTNYKDENKHRMVLITNENKTSSRQFIDWLNIQAKSNRSYNILAHNGGKFDFYFIISQFTEKEMLECKIQMRGTTVIGIEYRSNLFKDSCCFITNSLSNICESYKIEEGKICSMEIHGKIISSTQLCFYKPELTFNQFMDLQHTDKEFWELYTKYCLYDCIALTEIWKKFTICVNSLIEKINPYLLRKCPLMSSSTIGSHSKKILVELNKFKGESNFYKKDIELFTGVEDKIIDKKKVRTIDKEKYDFLCKFKRGGISHCHQMGKHTSGITGVDIASQYPASLVYAFCPTGYSHWTKTYDSNDKGFYLINNLVFDTEYSLKPIAKSIQGTSLQWATTEYGNLYIDSYMLDYVIKNHGLKTFNVVNGLVSKNEILLSKLFGKYVNTFYTEKKRQDDLKETKDESYNPALRETIKLYLNSLTGKLVEDPSIHFSLKFNEESEKMINGVGVEKEFNDDKINDWIIAGIMVYSYSKRLLFEYIKCLPDKSNDVIHIETDGIYFSTEHLPKFLENLEQYDGDYPCMLGVDVGNLKIEKTTKKGTVAYFLGKKFYHFDKTYRIKGIPQSTISPDGSKIQLVNTELYEDIYKGKSIVKNFQTLQKAFYGIQTKISTHTMTRTIRPNGHYKLFE